MAWIVGALEGAAVVGGLSALGAGLYSIGIPKNSVLKYETAIKADKFLLVAQGLPALRGNEWVAGLAEGLNVVKVSVADVRVEHEVRLKISRPGFKGTVGRRAG